MSAYLKIELDTRQLATFLLAIALGFLVLDIVQYTFGYHWPAGIREFFDITLEANLPTWYSSLLASLTGITAMMVAWLMRNRQQFVRMLGWTLIALFFLYVGIDDATELHERIATSIAADVTGPGTNGVEVNGPFDTLLANFKSYHWQLIFLPFFALAGLFMLWFLRREFATLASFMLFAGGIGCYVIAVGLDYIDGIPSLYEPVTTNLALSLHDARHISRAIEEFLEILGTGLILIAFLQQLAQPDP